jgi:hypothetical protein
VKALKGRYLTLILLTWSIGSAPNNASKFQVGFNSAFKGLNKVSYVKVWLNEKVARYTKTKSIQQI